MQITLAFNSYELNSGQGSRCNISNPSTRTGIDFKSAQVEMTSHTNKYNYNIKWGELILIQSKDGINFDPAL